MLEDEEFALPVLTVVAEAENSFPGSSCALRFPIASEAESDLFLFRMAANLVSVDSTPSL